MCVSFSLSLGEPRLMTATAEEANGILHRYEPWTSTLWQEPPAGGVLFITLAIERVGTSISALKPSGFSAASRVESREFISTSFRVSYCSRFGVISCEERRVVKIKVMMMIKRVNFSVLATTATKLYLTIRHGYWGTNEFLVTRCSSSHVLFQSRFVTLTSRSQYGFDEF